MPTMQYVIVKKGNTKKQISEYSWKRMTKKEDGTADGWAFSHYVFYVGKKQITGKVEDHMNPNTRKVQELPYVPEEIASMSANPGKPVEIPAKESGEKAPGDGKAVSETDDIDPNALKPVTEEIKKEEPVIPPAETETNTPAAQVQPIVADPNAKSLFGDDSVNAGKAATSTADPLGINQTGSNAKDKTKGDGKGKVKESGEKKN